MPPYIVALTGASGVIYGVRIVQELVKSGHAVALVISQAARLVIQEELGVGLKSYTQAGELEAVFGPLIKGKLQAFAPNDLAAPLASGSFPSSGMIIAPCSMGTLGAIAGGTVQNLIHRTADCMLKEGRRLVLVPRETPLNAIHLENMLKLSRLGVSMVPAMPGFYAGAKSVDELVDFLVGKVLDQMGIEHFLYPRWTGKTSPAGSARV